MNATSATVAYKTMMLFHIWLRFYFYTFWNHWSDWTTTISPLAYCNQLYTNKLAMLWLLA